MERREKTAAFAARTRLGKAPGSAAGRYLSGIRKPGGRGGGGGKRTEWKNYSIQRACACARTYLPPASSARWWPVAVVGAGRWLGFRGKDGWQGPRAGAKRSGDVTRQCAGLDASLLDHAFSTAISIFPLRFQKTRGEGPDVVAFSKGPGGGSCYRPIRNRRA
jgi:hypothetical protein